MPSRLLATHFVAGVSLPACVVRATSAVEHYTAAISSARGFGDRSGCLRRRARRRLARHTRPTCRGSRRVRSIVRAIRGPWCCMRRSTSISRRFAAPFGEHGAALPAFVERTLDAFLRRGDLQQGFVRVRCDGCGLDRMVPFSCKRRGFLPVVWRSAHGRGRRAPYAQRVSGGSDSPVGAVAAVSAEGAARIRHPPRLADTAVLHGVGVRVAATPDLDGLRSPGRGDGAQAWRRDTDPAIRWRAQLERAFFTRWSSTVCMRSMCKPGRCGSCRCLRRAPKISKAC